MLFVFVAIIFQLSATNSFESHLSKIVAISFGAKINYKFKPNFVNYQKILYFQNPLIDALNYIKKVIKNSEKGKNYQKKKNRA